MFFFFFCAWLSVLQHLAAQAAVAVDNARVFNELQASNREVAEALEQQRATAEVLDVISRSPSDLQAALDVVVQKAAALLASENALVLRWTAHGSGELVAASLGGIVSQEISFASPRAAPWWGSVADGIGASTLQLELDTFLRDYPAIVENLRAAGVRSGLSTPLTSTRGHFGLLLLSRHLDAPYTPEQVRLFETFATQAVIAIENAGLFNELQDSNADLAASVEREAALARISQRINEQPLDVDGTLVAIAEAARALTVGDGARVFLVEGDHLVPSQGAVSNSPAAYIEFAPRVPVSSPAHVARALRERRSVALDDLLEDVPESIRAQFAAAGMRSTMAAPLGRTERDRRNARGRTR